MMFPSTQEVGGGGSGRRSLIERGCVEGAIAEESPLTTRLERTVGRSGWCCARDWQPLSRHVSGLRPRCCTRPLRLSVSPKALRRLFVVTAVRDGLWCFQALRGRALDESGWVVGAIGGESPLTSQ
jgi:hypothetical protein